MSVTTKLPVLATAGLLLVLGASCTQPRMNCTTAHSTYAAKYTLKSGDPNSPCGALPGDFIEMQTYFATGGLNGTPKFSEPSLAIRTGTSVAANIIPDDYGAGYGPDGGPVPIPGYTYDYYVANALGKFAAGVPDDDDFCTAKDMMPSVVSTPELPSYMIPDDPATMDVDETETVPATPATTMRHEWTKARWLVSPDAQGTQFDGTVKFVVDGCTAEYDVIAVSPAVSCEKDEDCAAEGIGINPDFAVVCDLGIGACVPSKALPAYK
jgi:hypothetical protein